MGNIKIEGLVVSSGLGLEILSVTAPSVPAVKQVIRAVDSNWARALSKIALTLNSTEAVHDFFREKQRETLTNVRAGLALPVSSGRY